MTLTKERIIEELKASTQNASGMFEINEDTICALMELLESRADAEPVAWRWNYGGTTTWRIMEEKPKFIGEGSVPRIVEPLYTRPQPAPVVPQIIHSQGGTTVYADYYAIGWNACRAAMLQGKDEPVSQPYTLPECFDRLFKHAQGLTFGDDWNRGTAAKYHRDSLIKAVDDCRATLAAAPQQEAK